MPRGMTHETLWSGLEEVGINRLDHPSFTTIAALVDQLLDKSKSQSANFWTEVDRNGPGIFVRIDAAGRILEDYCKTTPGNRLKFKRADLATHVSRYVSSLYGGDVDADAFSSLGLVSDPVGKMRWPKKARAKKIPYIIVQEVAECLCDLFNRHVRPETARPLAAHDFLHHPSSSPQHCSILKLG